MLVPFVLNAQKDYPLLSSGENILEGNKCITEGKYDKAIGFFENIPVITKKLKTLKDVGLGSIHLGQQATTLSGGEAQRVIRIPISNHFNSRE